MEIIVKNCNDGKEYSSKDYMISFSTLEHNNKYVVHIRNPNGCGYLKEFFEGDDNVGVSIVYNKRISTFD